MVESLNIANQIISKLISKTNAIRTKTLLKHFGTVKKSPYRNMESLIEHFKY